MINKVIDLYANEADREYLLNNVAYIEDAIKRSGSESEIFIKKCCDYLLVSATPEFKKACEGSGYTPQTFYSECWCKDNALALLGVPRPEEQDVCVLLEEYRKFLKDNCLKEDCKFCIEGYSKRAVDEILKFNVHVSDGYVVPNFCEAERVSALDFCIGDDIESMLKARSIFICNRDTWFLEMVECVKKELLHAGNKKCTTVDFGFEIEPLMENLSSSLIGLHYQVSYSGSRMVIEWNLKSI